MAQDDKYGEDSSASIAKQIGEHNITISLSSFLDILNNSKNNSANGGINGADINRILSELNTTISEAKDSISTLKTLQGILNSLTQTFTKQLDDIKKQAQFAPRANRLIDRFRRLRMANTCYSYLPDDEQRCSPLFQYGLQLRNLLVVHDVEGHKLTRVGDMADGGYTMVDNFDSQAIAYSCGISTNVSWDKDMAARGIYIYMYDHTINKLPEEDSHFHWQKTGICGNNSVPGCTPLAELLQKNGHLGNSNMILKMDIEGAEYDAINDLPLEMLNQFSQIVLEIHQLFNVALKEKIITFLEKLNVNHKLVDINANNNGPCIYVSGMAIPDTLELCFVRVADYNLSVNKHYYPREFHYPNDKAIPPIQLGVWNKYVTSNNNIEIGKNFYCKKKEC